MTFPEEYEGKKNFEKKVGETGGQVPSCFIRAKAVA